MPTGKLATGMKVFLLHIAFLYCFSGVMAQERKNTSPPDSLVKNLSSVEIIYTSQNSYKTVWIDTTLIKVNKGRTLADLLQNSGVAYLRQYAPGQIATISMRGSSASHVQLLWNGFNLNNLSLGQTDFSLVPVSLFTGVQVNLGSMGASGGNGVVAGSVELRNHYRLNPGQTFVEAGAQAGSFGKYAAQAAVVHRSEKTSFSIKPFYSFNQNNYTFTNAEGKKDTVEHAQTHMAGLLATGTVLLNRSDITASAWIQETQREIPATVFEAKSYATQNDQSLRFSVNQLVYGQGFFKANRLGYFYDRLNYTNTLYDAESSGFKVHNFIGETESYWNIRRGEHRIKIFASGASAFNTGYESSKKLFRSSVGYFFQASRHRRFHWDYSAALKEEINNHSFSIPITQFGLAGWYNKTVKNYAHRFTGRLNFGTVYRFPTLNDMYWYPGGNPGLKPEKGASANITVEWNLADKRKKGLNFLNLGFTHYQRYVYDWIMWQPRGVYWSPQNLQEVWSRGTETSMAFQLGNRFKFHTKAVLNYTLSSIQKSKIDNDQSLGRQLIYTPMYNANGETGILFKGFSLSGTAAYYGYRYTSSDNYEYLSPFYLLGARAAFTHKLKNMLFDFFITAENLLNENYYWVAQRPALPRNYTVGLNIKWTQTKTQINSN